MIWLWNAMEHLFSGYLATFCCAGFAVFGAWHRGPTQNLYRWERCGVRHNELFTNRRFQVFSPMLGSLLDSKPKHQELRTHTSHLAYLGASEISILAFSDAAWGCPCRGTIYVLVVFFSGSLDWWLEDSRSPKEKGFPMMITIWQSKLVMGNPILELIDYLSMDMLIHCRYGIWDLPEPCSIAMEYCQFVSLKRTSLQCGTGFTGRKTGALVIAWGFGSFDCKATRLCP